MDKASDSSDADFWNNADRTWEAVRVLVPFATALCLLAVLLTLLSWGCTSLQNSPRLSLVAFILNVLAFAFALGSWVGALDTSQLTADDYKGVDACSKIEVTLGPGLVLTMLASILLFVSTVTSSVWKCRAGAS
jgi:hypothetical protein